jgi:hypothetical protein
MNGKRIGVGLGWLSAVAAGAVLLPLLGSFGCSGSSDKSDPPEQDGGSGDPAPIATVDPPATPPPPPASPLPEQLNFDGGFPEAAPLPADSAVRTMWAVSDSNQLVKFTNLAPAAITMLPITGLASGERVMGIDFRAADGTLYAVGSTSRLYSINRTTGVASPVGLKSFTPQLEGIDFGAGMDPMTSAMRVQSDYDQNLHVDYLTGAATMDAMLAFAKGDANEGQSPNLVATAYTNSVTPAPTSTVLYALDSTRNLLTKLANPSDGQINTIGDLGVDISDVAGFDIWGGTPGTGAAKPLEAYAVLMSSIGKQDMTGLFTVDLTTGAATLIGVIGAVGTLPALHGLAVEP